MTAFIGLVIGGAFAIAFGVLLFQVERERKERKDFIFRRCTGR